MTNISSAASSMTRPTVAQTRTAPDTPAHEAAETPAVTKKEAAKGDQVEVRKMAASQAQYKAQSVERPPQPVVVNGQKLNIVA